MNCSRTGLRAAVSSFLLLTAAASLLAQDKKQTASEGSCKAYVQQFYKWYVPAMLHPGNKVMSDVALDRKDFVFSPELSKALKDDLAASKKNSDEIVGLDFDPFLNTQDPAHHYVVGKTVVQGGRCQAPVHAINAGKWSPNPDVVAALELQNGRWVFTNFLYPANEKSEDRDLLSVLNTLKNYREQKK